MFGLSGPNSVVAIQLGYRDFHLQSLAIVEQHPPNVKAEVRHLLLTWHAV